MKNTRKGKRIIGIMAAVFKLRFGGYKIGKFKILHFHVSCPRALFKRLFWNQNLFRENFHTK